MDGSGWSVLLLRHFAVCNAWLPAESEWMIACDRCILDWPELHGEFGAKVMRERCRMLFAATNFRLPTRGELNAQLGTMKYGGNRRLAKPWGNWLGHSPPRPVAHNLGIGITFRPRFVRYLCCMAKTLALAPDASRKQRYEALSNRWKSLLGNEPNRMANLANAAAVLKEAFDWHWVGFYLVDKQRDELVLGPFQGPLACTRLHHGNGVCAAAWDESTVQLVPDVHEFEGHVACSSLTESELVIPIVSADEVVAVLDIDSVKRDDVSAVDVEGLTPLVDFLGQNWNVWE